MAAGTDAPTKAAIYCRVSTEDQARPDKVSLSDQRGKTAAYCQSQGWTVSEVYEDAGVSGAKSSRPALDSMMADAREGKFERVVFLKLDRLGRKTKDLLEISEQLDTHGVGIVSVHDSFDTGSPSGRMYFTILGAVAEFERELIGERTAAGRLGRARKGLWHGRTPYGYDYNPETEQLVVNEVEAAVVLRIFGLYVDNGWPHRKIADQLNSEGVRTKDKATYGWHRAQISKVLNNNTYVGQAHFNKTVRSKNGRSTSRRPRDEWITIDVPPIVSEEKWNAAQERAKTNARWSQLPQDRKTDFLLSSIIFCECGSKIYGVRNRRQSKGRTYSYRYYQCRRHNQYGTPCRERQRVSAERIEGAVVGVIVEAFSDPEKVLAACSAYADQLQAAQDGQEGRVADLQRRLKEAVAEKDRIIGFAARGSITEAQMGRQMDRLESEVGEWNAELTRMEEASRQLERVSQIKESAYAIADRIEAVVGELTVPEKKELLRALIERVWVGPKNEIRIECVIPELSMAQLATV